MGDCWCGCWVGCQVEEQQSFKHGLADLAPTGLPRIYWKNRITKDKYEYNQLSKFSMKRWRRHGKLTASFIKVLAMEKKIQWKYNLSPIFFDPWNVFIMNPQLRAHLQIYCFFFFPRFGNTREGNEAKVLTRCIESPVLMRAFGRARWDSKGVLGLTSWISSHSSRVSILTVPCPAGALWIFLSSLSCSLDSSTCRGNRLDEFLSLNSSFRIYLREK